MNIIKNALFQGIISVGFSLSITACGGGGSDNSTPVVNMPPQNVSLSNVQVTSDSQANVSWMVANDDNTIASQLNYEVHVSEDLNFTPSAETLKLVGTGILSANISGLKASTKYAVRLVAVDTQGLRTVSNSMVITTKAVAITNVDFNIARAVNSFVKNGGNFDVSGVDSAGNTWTLNYQASVAAYGIPPSSIYTFTIGDQKVILSRTLRKNGSIVSTSQTTRFYKETPFSYSYFGTGGSISTFFQSVGNLPSTADNGKNGSLATGTIFGATCGTGAYNCVVGGVRIGWSFTQETTSLGYLCFNAVSSVDSKYILSDLSECLSILPNGGVLGMKFEVAISKSEKVTLK